MLSRQIEQRGSAIHQCPGCRQRLTGGTVVDVARRIISKVAAREGAIVAVCTENLNTGVVVMKSAQDGA